MKPLQLSVGVHAGKKIADPEICGENNEKSHKDINMVKTRRDVAVKAVDMERCEIDHKSQQGPCLLCIPRPVCTP